VEPSAHGDAPDRERLSRGVDRLEDLARRDPAGREIAARDEAGGCERLGEIRKQVGQQQRTGLIGRDVVVVVSLGESTFYDHSYALGFPRPGDWHEVFNSDLYDHFANPWAQGNPGGITAGGPPMHGLPCSAQITIPANSLLVFARDLGD
jgi:hypothetical protein